MDTLLLIDGNALAHRAYHALPPFKTFDGTPTNAVYGFTTVTHKIISGYKPKFVIVCFDHPDKTFRDKLFADYRAQRPKTDDNLIKQFPIIAELLDSAGIYHLQKKGFEADDLIAHFTFMANKKKIKTIILTGDKDIFQLINDYTFVLTPGLGFGKEKMYDSAAVKEKLGIEPKSIPDYKALAGDPSDNYRGVEGIGPKGAVLLISQFGTIENIYKNIDKVENPAIRKKLIDNKKNALLSKKLAVLINNLDIDDKLENAIFIDYDQKLNDFFDKYQFFTLKNRMLKSTLKPPVKIKNPKTKEQIELF